MMEISGVQSRSRSVAKDHSLVLGDASGKGLHGSCHLIWVRGCRLNLQRFKRLKVKVPVQVVFLLIQKFFSD